MHCPDSQQISCIISDFIWDFGKLLFPTHLGKYFIKIGKIRAKIYEIGKIKAIFGMGMTPLYGLKNGQIKSLIILRNQVTCSLKIALVSRITVVTKENGLFILKK